jgi:hypothetical protein
VGLGGDASYDRKHDSDEVYKCATLETDYFRADKKYIWESLQNEEVKAYFEDNWFKNPLYMITGLKIAKGFSVETKDTKSNGIDTIAGVDLTAEGVPLQVGPKVKLVVSKKENVSFKEGADCVFAYQAIRIRPKRNDKFREEDFNRGALMNSDGKDEKHGMKEFSDDWEVQGTDGAPEDAVDAVEYTAYEELDGE